MQSVVQMIKHSSTQYIGRFAPSPTGPLHAGSLVAALASYLDARAHEGHWLLRIEDLDEVRTVVGAAEDITSTLAAFGMQSDGEIVLQSQRKDLYQIAFEQLAPYVFPCSCSRKEIADSRTSLAADGAAIYPGTCRAGLIHGRSPRAWRLRVPDDQSIEFTDRLQGLIREHLATEVGDFVLKRADGFWAYQLAVVVDDALQGVTDVVRGADLLGSTSRQIYLQQLLDLPTPRFMHVPVVVNAAGEKLSKQTGAQSIDMTKPLEELINAAKKLGLELKPVNTLQAFWAAAIPAWLVLTKTHN
jgi:glutamyl-Q tRNA(Asp) synthetase